MPHRKFFNSFAIIKFLGLGNLTFIDTLSPLQNLTIGLIENFTYLIVHRYRIDQKVVDVGTTICSIPETRNDQIRNLSCSNLGNNLIPPNYFVVENILDQPYVKVNFFILYLLYLSFWEPNMRFNPNFQHVFIVPQLIPFSNSKMSLCLASHYNYVIKGYFVTSKCSRSSHTCLQCLPK